MSFEFITEALPDEIEISLFDFKTGTEINIHSNMENYVFNAEADDDPLRFELVFREGQEDVPEHEKPVEGDDNKDTEDLHPDAPEDAPDKTWYGCSMSGNSPVFPSLLPFILGFALLHLFSRRKKRLQ